MSVRLFTHIFIFIPEAEATRMVMEEIFADAFAGTNKFGTDVQDYTEPARIAAEETGQAKISEYNDNQGRAPPQGMTYDDVKNAVREVLGEVMGTQSNKNTADEGGVEQFTVSEDAKYKEYEKPITEEDIQLLRSVGRKSVGQFSSEDIKKAQKWAYKYFKEMGVSRVPIRQ